MNPAGTYVSPVWNQVTAAEAVAGFHEALVRLGLGVSPGAVATFAAQSALESGRWKKMVCFNPSNIKHGSRRTGSFTCITLNEREKRNGKIVTIWYTPEGELDGQPGKGKLKGPPLPVPPGAATTRMRAYDSFAEGVADKLVFLSLAKWKPMLQAALRNDPAEYSRLGKVLGYYTAAEDPYTAGVISLHRTFLPLAEAYAAQRNPPTAMTLADAERLGEEVRKLEARGEPSVEAVAEEAMRLCSRFPLTVDGALAQAGLDIANHLRERGGKSS